MSAYISETMLTCITSLIPVLSDSCAALCNVDRQLPDPFGTVKLPSPGPSGNSLISESEIQRSLHIEDSDLTQKPTWDQSCVT